jgi:hypothetical protein
MSDDVKGLGHVGGVDQIVGNCPHVVRKRLAGCPHQVRKTVSQEFGRLAFQFALPSLVSAEDWARSGAEGTAIEEGDRRVEKKVSPKSKQD